MALMQGDPTIILWVFFWFGFVVTAGFAFGLIYHWVRFGNVYPLALAMLPVYVIGVVVLLGAMLAGLASV